MCLHENAEENSPEIKSNDEKESDLNILETDERPKGIWYSFKIHKNRKIENKFQFGSF